MERGETVEGFIEPIPAFVERDGERITVGHICGKCRRLYVSTQLHWDSRAVAVDCCFRQCACGALTGGTSWTACEECRERLAREREEERDRARREKAERVLFREYDGEWLFWEEGFYADLDTLLDHCALEELPPPGDAWACRPIKLRFDVEDMLEHALSDHHDEAYDQISEAEKDALQRQLDAWCDATGVVSYEPDYKRLVILEEVCGDATSAG